MGAHPSRKEAVNGVDSSLVSSPYRGGRLLAGLAEDLIMKGTRQYGSGMMSRREWWQNGIHPSAETGSKNPKVNSGREKKDERPLYNVWCISNRETVVGVTLYVCYSSLP